MGLILWGFSSAQKEVRKCPGNPSAPVPIPDAPTLQREDSARNTNARKTNATRSMTVIRLYAVGMDEPGSASVTAMFSSTHCVNCVSGRVGWSPQRRSIIRSLFPRVAHTTEAI